MFPSEWRDVPEQAFRHLEACAPAFPDRASGLAGVPAGDDRCEQIESGSPEVPGLGCPVTNFAPASDPQGALRGTMCLAPVQAGTGTPLRVDVRQSLDDERRAFDPSDLSQRGGRAMPARVRRELPQELAWRHRPGRRRGRAAQAIGPVAGMQPVVCPASAMRLSLPGRSGLAAILFKAARPQTAPAAGGGMQAAKHASVTAVRSGMCFHAPMIGKGRCRAGREGGGRKANACDRRFPDGMAGRVPTAAAIQACFRLIGSSFPRQRGATNSRASGSGAPGELAEGRG